MTPDADPAFSFPAAATHGDPEPSRGKFKNSGKNDPPHSSECVKTDRRRPPLVVDGNQEAGAARAPAEAVWRELLSEQFRRHGALFLRLAQRVVKDRETAEDVCQQAYLHAWERPGIEPGALRAWLVATLFNTALQVVRRRKAEQRVLRLHAASQREAAATDETGHLRESLLAAVQLLPPMPQACVVLRLLEGMSGNDAKEVLGCSGGEVSRQLYRGLEQLRGDLGGPLGGLR